MLALSYTFQTLVISLAVIVVVFLGFLALLVKCYRKVAQGEALIRNGMGGTQVSFSGKIVIPILHKVEYMDVSVKRIEIDRHGAQGLICQDNLRADIKVAFFVDCGNLPRFVLLVLVGCSVWRGFPEHKLVHVPREEETRSGSQSL